MTQSLRIEKAQRFGFFVVAQDVSRHGEAGVLCAGSLEECLGFVKDEFTPTRDGDCQNCDHPWSQHRAGDCAGMIELDSQTVNCPCPLWPEK